MGVSVGPGETVLTRTPCGTTSIARTRYAWRMPALDAAYAAWRMRGIRDAIDATPTIDP